VVLFHPAFLVLADGEGVAGGRICYAAMRNFDGNLPDILSNCAAGWGGYRNGDIPYSAMRYSPASNYMHPAASLAYDQLYAAGLAAGLVNAVAGGGSLLVFPALLAVGLPPLQANVTNSVAQWPGFLGLVLGGREELEGQRGRIVSLTAVAVAGSLVGCLLLLALPGAVFDTIVPVLVLLASLLLAAQSQLKRLAGNPGPDAPDRPALLLPVVFVASIYGGYFGGALGVILISVLALATHDRLVRVNALKGVLSLIITTVTVVVFAIAAPVDWLAVAVLAPATLVGGFIGARVARRLPEAVLRWSVVTLGIAVAVYLFVR